MKRLVQIAIALAVIVGGSAALNLDNQAEAGRRCGRRCGGYSCAPSYGCYDGGCYGGSCYAAPVCEAPVYHAPAPAPVCDSCGPACYGGGCYDGCYSYGHRRCGRGRRCCW
jgi:hypothetical protein